MKKKKVIIEIHSGMAEVISCPKDVTVEIKDYDVCGSCGDILNEDKDGKKYFLIKRN